MATWAYPPEFREVLLAVGLRPTPATPPTLVREALNDLYRHELRRLRDRHVAGDVPKAAYVDRVIALRRKYWLLAFPDAAWEKICRGEGGTPDAHGADSTARNR